MTDDRQAALLRAIEQHRAQDPLVGVKLGAQEIRQRLLKAMATSSGVHIESLLAVCGALAGHSCQASLRARSLSAGQSETACFQTVGSRDGRSFLIGEALTQTLVGGTYSPWNLAAGGAQQAGCEKLPDLDGMLRHGMETLGKESFGVPLVSEQHLPAPGSLQVLADLWPALFPLARTFCPDPEQWPILFGLLAQQVISMGKEVIDPCMALRIVMDTAIANAMVILPGE